MIPRKFIEQLEEAVKTEQYMVAIWKIKHGKIHLERTTKDFPREDFDKAIDLLDENLRNAK